MFYVGGHVAVQTILMVESTPTGHAAGLINVAVILEKITTATGGLHRSM